MTKALDAAGAPPMTADRDADDKRARDIIREGLHKLECRRSAYGSKRQWSEYCVRYAEAMIAALSQAETDLAALRRRVAQMEEALRAIATQSVYEEDEFRYQLQDMIDAAREVASAALSPSPPAEERESGT